LGKLPAAKVIDDEVTPAFGDALEPEKRLRREAVEAARVMGWSLGQSC